MSSASPAVSTGYRPGSPRQRTVSIVLSAAIIIIALLIAVYQTGATAKFGGGRALVSFDVTSERADATRSRATKRRQRAAASARPRTAAQQPRARLAVAKPNRQERQLDAIPGFIHLSRADLAASDIGRMHAPAGAKGDGDGDSAAADGPGEGPGGVRLYNADWYREPTDAQLAGYLPKDAPRNGWGMVACQTVEHYRVENCQILDESPMGSGFGRAVLNAAWQFQVLPPRINSRPQIGAWVRIRITYSVRGANAG